VLFITSLSCQFSSAALPALSAVLSFANFKSAAYFLIMTCYFNKKRKNETYQSPFFYFLQIGGHGKWRP